MSESRHDAFPAQSALLDTLIVEGPEATVHESAPARAAVDAAVGAFLARAAGPDADLLAGIVVAPARVSAVQAALGTGRAGVRVTLSAGAAGDSPWTGSAEPDTDLRQARNLLVDDDRVDLVGLHLPLPAPHGPRSLTGQAAAVAAAALLEGLDSIVPAWIEVPEQALAALEVIAADGVEEVAVRVGDDDGHPRGIPVESDVARLLRRCVDLGLTVHAVGGVRDAVRSTDPVTGAERHGLLNLLCAVRVALEGATEPEIAGVLAERRPAVLAARAQAMTPADAAAVRGVLATITVSEPAAVLEDLRVVGLLAGE